MTPDEMRETGLDWDLENEADNLIMNLWLIAAEVCERLDRLAGAGRCKHEWFQPYSGESYCRKCGVRGQAPNPLAELYQERTGPR